MRIFPQHICSYIHTDQVTSRTLRANLILNWGITLKEILAVARQVTILSGLINPNHLFLFFFQIHCSFMGQNKEQSQPFVSLSGQTKMYLQLWKYPFSTKISLSVRKGALWNWKWFLPVSIHTWQIVFWLWIENTRGRRYGFHEKNPNQIFLKSKQTFCDNKNV